MYHFSIFFIVLPDFILFFFIFIVLLDVLKWHYVIKTVGILANLSGRQFQRNCSETLSVPVFQKQNRVNLIPFGCYSHFRDIPLCLLIRESKRVQGDWDWGLGRWKQPVPDGASNCRVQHSVGQMDFTRSKINKICSVLKRLRILLLRSFPCQIQYVKTKCIHSLLCVPIFISFLKTSLVIRWDWQLGSPLSSLVCASRVYFLLTINQSPWHGLWMHWNQDNIKNEWN